MNASKYHLCSFESRRQNEMARLIERAGGVPTIAPSMREIPLSDNSAVFEFADRLCAGQFPIVIFMTGVGTEAMFSVLETRNLVEPVLSALQSVQVVARGPKPFAALSKMKVRVDIRAPEPNTWQDMVTEMVRHQVAFAGKKVAVQEYGAPSIDLYQWLKEHQAEAFPVPVYRWALPEDLAPLQHAIEATIAGKFDILLWTSAQQINHVLEVAQTMGVQSQWLAAANRCVIGSIGPTASERLRSLGLPPDLEPSHPKMAHLVNETIQQAPEILSQKR
jgi:Uroporphyrinogen-III synthase